MTKTDLSHCQVMHAQNPLVDISSSMIRERLGAGTSVRFLMPDAVIDYIRKNGLYEKHD